MMLLNVAPAGPLQHLIRLYRIIDFDFSGQSEAFKIKAYRPRVEHCLQFTPFDAEVVRYQDGRTISTPVALFGQHTVLTHRTVGSIFVNIQVVFIPGVLPRLTRIPADELSNLYFDASHVFGSEVHEVNDRLRHCKNVRLMVEIIEKFLMKAFAGARFETHAIDRIPQLMVNTHAQKTIAWYARQANVCARQFDRAFKKSTGITPKEFQLLIKMDQAYLKKNNDPGDDWLTIAIKTGFHDYQHLSKVFKQFTGYSPSEFYKLELKSPERTFGDFER